MIKTIIREYHLDEESIKEALKLEGDIDGFQLWRGLSPTQEKEGMSHSRVQWEITTKEVREEDNPIVKESLTNRKEFNANSTNSAPNSRDKGIDSLEPSVRKIPDIHSQNKDLLDKDYTISGEDKCKNCIHIRELHDSNGCFVYRGTEESCKCKKFVLDKLNAKEKDHE